MSKPSSTETRPRGGREIRWRRWLGTLALALAGAAALTAWLDAPHPSSPSRAAAATPAAARAGELTGAGRHLALNLGGDAAGAAALGFDLADAGSVAGLDALPPDMQGVLWLGNGFNTRCAWRLDDAAVIAAVEAARAHPAFSGIYYIADEPHVAVCPEAPERVAERTALIHAHDPRGRTLIVVQNGAKGQGEFAAMAASADLIAVDPYPCNHRNAETGCDLGALRTRIATALEAGIPPTRLVPVFQVFGQACAGKETPWYRLPSEAELLAMLAIWDELVPRDRRPLDIAYSWAPQEGSACPTLAMAGGGDLPDLRAVMRAYLAGRSPRDIEAARR
ncbi:hypothetical protein [Albimonas pacifica]|uniref:Uncharacterized protein n=1 Tax=Albimonas pacifica TaxID=1114924 RepID=A0A1I3IWI9_9RHOB|nr:hypothetical protein [Albimonas pacifica]SFI52286.1 hypothetical protein SAMN05216258_107255 [Albimonas pacifica]